MITTAAIEAIRTRTTAVDNEKIMTELRNSEQDKNTDHHKNLYHEKTYHGVASTKGGARLAAGRTAYREEYQRDYGPDLDEPLDVTESGQEF
jgi:hypothetical protein